MTALVIAAALVNSACGDEAVVIEVRSDLAVPRDLDAICLEVSSEGRAPFARRYALAGDGAPALPATLTVMKGGGSFHRAVARGYRDGREVVRASAALEFGGGVSTLPMSIGRCQAQAKGAAITERATAPAADGALVAQALGQGKNWLVVFEPTGARGLQVVGSELRAHGGAVPALTALPRAVEVADADGDCDDDLVVLAADGSAALWRHDGVGAFTAEPLPGAPLVGALALGDVDGDADPDVIWIGARTARLLLNDGLARFTEDAAGIQPAPTDATAIDVGDFTGDGALDLIIGQGDAAAAAPKAYANDGAGHLRASSAFIPEAPARARTVLLADLDGDLDLDAVLAGVGYARVLVNRGNGRFDDRSFERLPLISGDVLDVAGGDVDGDCNPDLTLALAGSNVALVLEGNASGGFVAAAAPGARAATSALAVDLDGDGVKDMLLAGGAGGVQWLAGR